VPEEPRPASATAPRGFYAARVDEKGRLKLPVNFQEFLGGEKLFCTSLDTRIARVYPLSVWQANEKMLAELTEDPDTAEDLKNLADHYGADSEIDPQGRVLLPTDLRRELRLENQQVWLQCFNGAISVYNKDVYDEQVNRAKTNIADKLKLAKQKGLK
jgi:MraZ protein